ncbi:MAG: hypothetical protein RJQ09_06500 [Cyclobacteriaceae bacterium]
MIIFNFSQFTNLLGVDIFGPQFYYIEQLWYFKLLGIEHTYPWTNYFFFALLQASTVALMLGFKTRTAIALMVLSIFYLKGVRDSAAGDDHHRYLMWMNVLFILFVSKSHLIYAVSNKVVRNIKGWEANWPIRLMQVCVSSFYFISAVAKLRVSGLNWVIDGSAVQRVLLIKSARWDFEDLIIGQWFAQHPTLCWLAVLFTLAFEFTFPIFVFQKNQRIKGLFLVGATAFHILNKVMATVGFWATPLLFLLFFDLNKLVERYTWLKRIVSKLEFGVKN